MIATRCDHGFMGQLCPVRACRNWDGRKSNEESTRVPRVVQHARRREQRAKTKRAPMPSRIARELATVISQTLGTMSEADLFGTCRQSHIADGRAVLCWLLRCRGLSFPAIGTQLGLDHTTVMHHCRRVTDGPRLLALAAALDPVRARVRVEVA